MMEWLSWGNFFYLAGLIIAGVATLVASKYRTIVKEIKDVASELQKAYEDGKLSKEEKEDVMKEALDVLKAVINLKWRIFK
jgi:flagellar motor component MotA